MRIYLLSLIFSLLSGTVASQSAAEGFMRHALPGVGHIDLPLRFEVATAGARSAVDSLLYFGSKAQKSALLEGEEFLFVTERLNKGNRREPDAFVVFRIETVLEEGHVGRLSDTIAFTDEELLRFESTCRASVEGTLLGLGADMVVWGGVTVCNGGRIRYECTYQVPGEVEFQLIGVICFNYDRTHTLTLMGPRSALARDSSALEHAIGSLTITHAR